jgi:TonB family protein
MSTWSEALWRGMAVHLWQTSLVLLAIFSLGRAMRMAPARLAGALWWIGLAKLFLPLPLLGRPGTSWTPDGGGGVSGLEVMIVILDPGVWSRRAASPHLTPSAPAWSLLTLLWALGAAFVALRFVHGALRSRARVGVPVPEAGGEPGRRLRDALEETRVPPEHVRICPDRGMPAVRGLLRPEILMPECVVLALETEELRGIVLHEEAHRRRRDPLLAAVRTAAAALFYFYPLLWPLLGRLRRNAELACDEAALRAGVAPAAYARALARTVRLGLLRPAPSASANAAHPSLLQERFERITHARRFSPMPRHRIVIAAGLALVLTSLLVPLPGGAELQIGPTRGAFAGLESLSSADLKLPPGSWVGVRIRLAVDSTDKVRAATADSPVVFQRFSDEWGAVVGRRLPEIVALCFQGAAQVAVLEHGVLPVGVRPPDPQGAKPGGVLWREVRWRPFEIRWEIPSEGPLQWQLTRLVRDPEGEMALVLLSSPTGTEGFVLPQLIPGTKVQPEYPAEARAAGIEGEVVMKLAVAEDGTVRDVTVLRGIEGHPSFADSALQAVRKWRFRPALFDGKPGPASLTITVRFRSS